MVFGQDEHRSLSQVPRYQYPYACAVSCPKNLLAHNERGSQKHLLKNNDNEVCSHASNVQCFVRARLRVVHHERVRLRVHYAMPGSGKRHHAVCGPEMRYVRLGCAVLRSRMAQPKSARSSHSHAPQVPCLPTRCAVLKQAEERYFLCDVQSLLGTKLRTTTERAAYAISGTDPDYLAMFPLRNVREPAATEPPLPYYESLQTAPGRAYAALRRWPSRCNARYCDSVRFSGTVQCVGARYAMSGTEVAYGVTRSELRAKAARSAQKCVGARAETGRCTAGSGDGGAGAGRPHGEEPTQTRRQGSVRPDPQMKPTLHACTPPSCFEMPTLRKPIQEAALQSESSSETQVRNPLRTARTPASGGDVGWRDTARLLTLGGGIRPGW
eukprot:1070044-Rhodomonas_salina.2